MSKRQWLCICGVWVMAFFFLGFPSSWHKVIALLSGLIIIAIAYNIPQEIKNNLSNNNSTFIENENHEKEIV